MNLIDGKSEFWNAYESVLEEVRMSGLPRSVGYASPHRYRWLVAFDKFQQIFKKSDCQMLDIGATPFTLILRRLRPNDQLFALDMIDDWKGLLESHGIQFEKCNLESSSIPFSDNSLDFIFFCEVIEHLQTNPIPILADLRRVLKPGGILIIQTPNLARHSNRIRLCHGISPLKIGMPGSQFPPHWREYTLKELSQLISISKLKILEATYQTYFERGYHRRSVGWIAEYASRIVPSLSSGITLIAQKTHWW